MAGLRSPSGKPIVLPPIRPNAGVQARYQRALERMVEDMHRSYRYWIKAAWRAKTPIVAQDADLDDTRPSVDEFDDLPPTPHWTDGMSPTKALQTIMDRLARHWGKRFDEAASRYGKYYAQSSMDRSDAAFKALLKKSGFQIEFKLTDQARQTMKATIGEQIELIHSIAPEYHTKVSAEVMRSVARGGDLKTLTDNLEASYGITRRRAALIARDQNNKASASILRARQLQLGITKAIWLHSGGGNHPRPEHVAFSGEQFDVETGAFLEGKYVWPGTEINCKCSSRPVIEPIDAE